MAQTLEGTCPGVPMTDGQQVVLEARDPTTGAAVTGIKLTNINIYGIDLTADSTPGLEGPFMYVPGPPTGQAV